MSAKKVGLAATAAVLVLATTACEPAPSPWERELVTVHLSEFQVDGTSSSVTWSADGSAVAFSSSFSDLVPGNSGGDAGEDVFIRDLDTGVTTLASAHTPVDFSCCSRVDALSADGTKVLFHSSMPGVTSLPRGYGHYDYYLHDRVAGTTSVVSVDYTGEQTGNDESGQSWHRALMAPDGTKVAFESDASNLVWPRDENVGDDIFVRDMTTNTTTHVVGAFARLEGFSPDGTKVLFSTSQALVPEDGNADDDLYLKDLAAGTTTLVSANADGTAAGAPAYQGGILTPDGERVLFTSSSNDVVAGGVDTNGVADVFLRDLATGTTRPVSTDAAGAATMGGSYGLFSPDESKVVFETDGDLYVKDLTTGSVTLVTPRTGGDPGPYGLIDMFGFTGDGRVVVFVTDAGNFGPVDDNRIDDIYAHDLASGTTHVVSDGHDGWSAGGAPDGGTGTPVAAVSPVGRQVLFRRTNVFVATLPLADVAVTGSVDASDGALSYDLTVTNGGPDGAEDVSLVLALPEGTEVSDATTSAGTCEEQEARVVRCAFGAADPGAVADVTVSATVQAPSGSALTATAALTSATYDAGADNNVLTLRSNVG